MRNFVSLPQWYFRCYDIISVKPFLGQRIAMIGQKLTDISPQSLHLACRLDLIQDEGNSTHRIRQSHTLVVLTNSQGPNELKVSTVPDPSPSPSDGSIPRLRTCLIG